MNADAERDRLIRHSRKKLRLGISTPACLFCGCDRIEALLGVPFEDLPERIKRKVIERHHADGRNISDWIVHLCLNCHAIETDAQHDLSRPLRASRTPEERVAALLASDARFLRRLGEACLDRSAMLEREKDVSLGGRSHGEDAT